MVEFQKAANLIGLKIESPSASQIVGVFHTVLGKSINAIPSRRPLLKFLKLDWTQLFGDCHRNWSSLLSWLLLGILCSDSGRFSPPQEGSLPQGVSREQLKTTRGGRRVSYQGRGRWSQDDQEQPQREVLLPILTWLFLLSFLVKRYKMRLRSF